MNDIRFEQFRQGPVAGSDAQASIETRDEPAIVVEGLVKDFKSCRAIDHVDFSLERGGSIGLVGSNGAGKTSTILCLLGLLTPSVGRVTVLGADMARCPRKVLRRMSFASPYVNMPTQLTVRQNLRVFAGLYGVRDAKARISDLAWEFGLGEVLDRTVGSLSAGQKTRASLVKAFLNDPEILLLDEPTASLDPERSAFVHDLIDRHRRSKPASVVIASHNMIEVERLCERVIVMGCGRILETGSPRELTERYKSSSLYEAVQQISWPPSGSTDERVDDSSRRGHIT